MRSWNQPFFLQKNSLRSNSFYFFTEITPLFFTPISWRSDGDCFQAQYPKAVIEQSRNDRINKIKKKAWSLLQAFLLYKVKLNRNN